MKCEIIKDLIPLAAEGLCSEESEKEIAEHIRTCENCRLIYEKAPETTSEALPIPDEKETFKSLFSIFFRTSFRQILPLTASKILTIRQYVCVFFPCNRQNYARKSAHKKILNRL